MRRDKSLSCRSLYCAGIHAVAVITRVHLFIRRRCISLGRGSLVRRETGPTEITRVHLFTRGSRTRLCCRHGRRLLPRKWRGRRPLIRQGVIGTDGVLSSVSKRHGGHEGASPGETIGGAVAGFDDHVLPEIIVAYVRIGADTVIGLTQLII